ncbi:hypothetical protein FS837_000408, partial [Tulasnella sp. UAMH 9824]
MSSSYSLTLKPSQLSFHGCTHERTAERTLTIRSNEPASTLLLNMTAMAGRRYLYRVAPNVAYIKPDEELVLKVTRGKITKGTADGEWRDVLGIEAMRAIGPLEPQDPPKAEDPKALWARAIQTGQHITSWLIPMDHEQPAVPEIVVSGADNDSTEENESQTT